MEARAALSRSGMLNLPSNQNPVKMDATPTPPISSPPTVPVPAGDFACELSYLCISFHLLHCNL